MNDWNTKNSELLFVIFLALILHSGCLSSSKEITQCQDVLNIQILDTLKSENCKEILAKNIFNKVVWDSLYVIVPYDFIGKKVKYLQNHTWRYSDIGIELYKTLNGEAQCLLVFSHQNINSFYVLKDSIINCSRLGGEFFRHQYIYPSDTLILYKHKTEGYKIGLKDSNIYCPPPAP